MTNNEFYDKERKVAKWLCLLVALPLGIIVIILLILAWFFPHILAG